MIVSINQPAYLPALSYFDRIARSDLHIVLDHVQLEKGGFTNRNRIRQSDGRVCWLTVPVEKGKPIDETRISGTKWKRKHLDTLLQSYGGNHRGYRKHWSLLIPYAADWPLLNELLTVQRRLFLKALRIKTECVSTSLECSARGVKSELILNLCQEVGATTYLSGPNGRDYLDLPGFEKAGIDVAYHDYRAASDPPLSAVDYLLNPVRTETWLLAAPTSQDSSPTSKPQAAQV